MKTAILLSIVAAAQAFTVPPLTVRSAAVTATTGLRPIHHPLGLMSQDETDTIMQTATGCVEGECSLDEIDGLIEILKDQQKELSDRVQNVRGMIKSLEVVNKADDRSVDEVRETVRAIFRIFQMGDKASGNDYPALSKPMGYSGEVGDGPTTAYDALPPKRIIKKTP